MSDGTKKVLMGVIAAILVGLAVWMAKGYFGEDPVARAANMRTLMDIETNETFEFELTPEWGPYPHKNPKTGKETLYPIEWCFARECGKSGGTPVILNVWRGKPDEPTYCPKCGSLVRFHNPRPGEPEGQSEPPARDRGR